MMERWLKNELSLKRWRRFRRRRRSYVAVWLLLGIAFVSLTAEFWANSKPLIMRYEGEWYTPVLRDYHPSRFGLEGVVTNYRAKKWEGSNWALWPLIEWDPLESNTHVEEYPSAPTAENYFGTDDRGRDVLARLLYGFRYSMGYAVSVWLLVSLIGISFGAVTGYIGGKVDMVGQRIVEVVESLPWLLILLTIISIFSPDLWLFIAFTAILGWVTVSLYVRAEFLKLRKREYVEAARALGATRWQVIFKHILPNSLTPWITMSPFLVSAYVASLAALDYLGFGLKAPTPSWGELLAQAKSYFTTAWWLAVYPSAALFVTLVLLNLIGEGVRDALDPK